MGFNSGFKGLKSAKQPLRVTVPTGYLEYITSFKHIYLL